MLQLKARGRGDAMLFACPLKGDSWELWANEEIWVIAGYQSWQCYPVPVVCQRTALLCSNAASANDPAVALSAMNCCRLMGSCRTSHHSFFVYVVLVREFVEFQEIKQLRILAVNFHFCLCISGDHLVGKGINRAEGSVTEGNPLLPGLYYLFSI